MKPDTTTINYSHASNLHTEQGPNAALPVILDKTNPRSLLDVGCGTGTWLKAARNLGIVDICGIDGVSISANDLLFPAELFKIQNLTIPWNLGRKFDLALCLEVGEHLEAEHASTLVGSLTTHADAIVFSAACPGQDGQHHVNAQWPIYWQELFNQNGFVCLDEFRWGFWNDDRIEPWYRQNMFLARRSGEAGKEPRLKAVVHPGTINGFLAVGFHHSISRIERGELPIQWYLKLPFRALLGRLRKAGLGASSK